MGAKKFPVYKKHRFRWDILLVELAAKVGVTRTVILGLLLFFIFKGTTQQHEEFIDKFFLLKFTTGANYYLSSGIIFLVILLLYQYFYFKSRLELANEKVRELKKERDKLKEKYLK